MELQQLRYVVALAREQNFRRAAESAHISQPTLSQQLQKLERELHARLFERSSRQVKLTSPGESFLAHAQRVLDTLDTAVGEVKSRSKEITGTLRIGAIPTIAPYLLPPVLLRLQKKAPDLKMEIHDVTTSQILTYLREARFDIGVVSLPIHDRDFVTRTIGKEPFCLAVSRRSPLAGKKSMRSQEVRSHSLLILQEGHCFRNQSLAYCRLSPMDSRVTFQGSSLSSVVAMAGIGGGVTFVPRMAMAHHALKNIRFVKLTDPEPEREIGFIWRLTTPMTRAQEFFMETVEAEFQKMAC